MREYTRDTGVPADAILEGESQRVSVGAVDVFIDTARFEQDGSPMLIRIAAINLHRLDAVIAQLRVGVDDKPVTESQGRYVNNLAGWALRPPPRARARGHRCR